MVRPVYEESTVQFLSKFGSQLKRDGFYSAAEILESYSKGIFGSGFAYHDTEADRVIVVTNRHVVDHARTVDVEFTVGDNTPLKYSGCRVLAVDDEQDLAFVLLPERALGECATVQLHTQAVADGDVLFSAGYPALAGKPSWQLGQGIVSNRKLFIKSLTSGKEVPLIQHTAPVDAGSSGGPLLVKVDGEGGGYRVVGVNTWKAGDRENTSFAISTETIKEGIDNLSKADEIEGKAKDFLVAAQGQYADVMPYVSYNLVRQTSASEFYDMVNACSDAATDAIAETMQQGLPLDGIRIAIADIVCRQFSGKGYRVESLSADSASATVVYSSGEKSVETEWKLEQGKWRMSRADNMRKSNIEKNGISKTYGFGTSIYANIGFPVANTADYGVQYAVSFKRTIRTFGTYEVGLGGIGINTTTIDWVEDSEGRLHEDSISALRQMFDLNVAIGGQVPIKYGAIYIVPYVKGIVGLGLGKEISGINYGIGAGIELAYKFGYSKYVLLNVGYQHRWIHEFSVDDLIGERPFQGINIALGVSF